jgi:hypothetical protein
VVTDASKRASDNPELQDMLATLATSNATTPPFEPPGPAIGMLKKTAAAPGGVGLRGQYISDPAGADKPKVEALPGPKRK